MKKQDLENQLKSFKLKIDKNSITFDFLGAIKEYHEYYNRVSDWIANNLTSKLKDCILPYVNENIETPQTYVKYVKQNQNMLLYNFIKSASSQLINCAIYEAIRKLNIDGYNGGNDNIFRMSETYYRRFGYVKCVIANYISSLSRLKPSVKKSKIDSQSDDEALMKNTLYEIVKNDEFKNFKRWEHYIEYLNSKADVKPETIERMVILRDYFENNKERVFECYEELYIERLQDFYGCKRRTDKMSMCITSGNHAPFNIKAIDWNCGYEMKLVCKDSIKLRLYGNKQVSVYNENGERVELTNIIESPSHSLTFTYENGEYYAIVSCYVPFDKKEVDLDVIHENDVVGIDVNVKHIMLATSVKDNGKIKGYVNIYKELLNDKEFVESINSTSPTSLKVYKELSEFVTFCPIEAETLYLRIYGEDKTEKAIQNVMDRLQKKYHGVDTQKRNYIAYTKMIRSKLVSYFKLDRAYQNEQKRYDIEMGYVDVSTDSKETMDKRRIENPFRNTEKANELIKKMANVKQDIIGCRNNIIEYAYNVLADNGYKLIAMENLTSSNLEKYKKIPSTISLLKYHKWENKTIDEIRKDEKENELYLKFKDKYEIITDSNNCVCDVNFSQNGVVEYYKPHLYNVIIKKIHFAEIKNKFIQMSNNNRMSTILVPPFYSSQMDSITHNVYVITEKVKRKTIMKLVNKHSVRNTQEKHINGLNADYNSARNLAHIALDNEWRKTFCRKEGEKYKNGYSKPVLTASVTSNFQMLNKIKKMGAVIEFSTIKTENKNTKSSVSSC